MIQQLLGFFLSLCAGLFYLGDYVRGHFHLENFFFDT